MSSAFTIGFNRLFPRFIPCIFEIISNTSINLPTPFVLTYLYTLTYLLNPTCPYMHTTFQLFLAKAAFLFPYFLNIHSFKKEVLFYKVKELFLIICLFLF